MSAIELTIAPRTRPVGNGEVLRLLPWRGRRMVGPFIFCDLFGPEQLAPGSGIDIDAHPHIGLATVSYLFEGRMVHRDSTGAVQTIEPGAVNWMTAGAAVAHTERSLPGDRPTARPHHGVQTWVALPAEAESGAAAFAHHPAGDLPADTYGGARVRVVVGESWGLRAPVAVASETLLAEIDLGTTGEATLAVDDAQHERAVLAIDGDLTLGGEPLPHEHLAVLTPGARPELAGRGRAIVLGGAPLGQRYIWWNFVHSDREVIEYAKAAWMAQEWPQIPGDMTPWIPLP
ncbi:MAG TPA: pirin family protein [Ilumatobacter sp.]|nr:pirin family protein [Ilumatobacter sp.]